MESSLDSQCFSFPTILFIYKKLGIFLEFLFFSSTNSSKLEKIGYWLLINSPYVNNTKLKIKKNSIINNQ